MFNTFTFLIGTRQFVRSRNSRLVSFISLLAIAGLVLGVAMLVVVLSIMNGFDREMETRILGQVPHLRLFEKSGAVPGRDQQALIARVEQHPAVVSAQPYVQMDALLASGGNVLPVSVEGLNLHLAMQAGGLLSDSGFSSRSDETDNSSGLYLAQGVADKLGLQKGQLASLLVPDSQANAGARRPPMMVRALWINGIFSTHTSLDQMLVVCDLGLASELAGMPGEFQGLRIETTNPFGARDAGYDLLRSLSVRPLSSGTETTRHDWRFTDWFQTHGNLYQAIKMSRNLVSLLVFLIIGVAVFNVVSMLVMTVVEKKSAIAIYITLGATRREVLGIFVVQGMLIGAAGVAFGLLLGLVLTINLDIVVGGLESLLNRPLLSSDVYPVDFVPTQIRGADLLAITVVSLLLNLLATLYPAWRAARNEPAKVLNQAI
ncbi:MAG: FtsX-like permease family protein [bacterium]